MEILIDNWVGYGSSVPTVANDASGREYLGWSVGEKAAFNFRLPESYVAGTDLIVTFEESTPGESKNHKWSINISRALDTAETVTEEVTSSSTADTNTEAAITLTSSGELNSVDLAVGDLISVVVSRIAASASEDSNDIKVYATSITIDTTEYAESGCLGRVGTMIDNVRYAFNDSGQERVTNLEIISYLNKATKELAREGVFMEETTLDLTADVETVDLLDQVTGFVDAFHARWHEDTHWMTPARSYADFRYRTLNSITTVSTPWLFYVQNNYLYFYPTVDTTTSDAIYLLHSYCPTDLDCSSNYTPEFPASFDSVIEAYAIAQCHIKFFPDSEAQGQHAIWMQRWAEGKRKFIHQHNPPVMGFRPYR